ncbi:MAG TPA: hypothetical protein VG077_07510 [Verrucomicrobiae bacterium]|nr:hypothetical protein [Verrucomicrobiae bacterium]
MPEPLRLDGFNRTDDLFKRIQSPALRYRSSTTRPTSPVWVREAAEAMM